MLSSCVSYCHDRPYGYVHDRNMGIDQPGNSVDTTGATVVDWINPDPPPAASHW